MITAIPALLPRPGTGSLYGSVPATPDPSSTAGAAISGNLGNLAGLYGLASGLNTFNAGQATNQLSLNLPNYAAMTNTASGDILSNLKGEVAPDVAYQLQQQAAERGVSMGSPLSPNAVTAFLAKYGLTSNALTQQGQSNLTSAISRTPTAPLFNTSSMLVTPEAQQSAATHAATMAAAPDPAATGQFAMNAVRGGASSMPWNTPARSTYSGPSYANYGPQFSTQAPGGGGSNLLIGGAAAQTPTMANVGSQQGQYYQDPTTGQWIDRNTGLPFYGNDTSMTPEAEGYWMSGLDEMFD